ncbi:MAG: hypothetical protein ACYTHN_23510, partial [Planctomycetota bacterium]
SFKSISAGMSFRSAPAKDTPRGFDTLFVVNLAPVRSKSRKAPATVPLRILHRGWTPDQVQLYWQSGRSKPVKLPRLEKGVHAYYLPFGPLNLKGIPSLTVHFYFPKTVTDRWKTGSKAVYLLPTQCRAGEVRIGGKSFQIALLDRTLNGCFTDPCTANNRDGDWLLIDQNKDGAFSVSPSGAESPGMTKYIALGGHTWSPSVRGKCLYLKPVTLGSFKVRLTGLGDPCTFSAWSYATGMVSGSLDTTGCAEIPKEKFQLYSYSWTKDEWRLYGSLRGMGTFDPPSKGTKTFEVGPRLTCTLTKSSQKGEVKFTFKCIGRAKESITLYKDGKRVQPTLVFSDSRGQEAERLPMKFG